MTYLFSTSFIRWIIVLVTQRISVLLFFAATSLIFLYFLWSRNSPLCQHVPCQERGSPPARSGPWPRLLPAPAVVEAITASPTGQSIALQSKPITVLSRSFTLEWDCLFYCHLYECLKWLFTQAEEGTIFRYFKWETILCQWINVFLWL